MCGICGYIYSDNSRHASMDVLKGMTDTLSLRGPDDHGLYVKDNVALGHRRLSIIDLKTGHQPMFNEDGSIAIVCNGEIYNFPELRKMLSGEGHRFSTLCDTEVIIHAYEKYGEDCLKHFNGMFAFAIWDSRSRKIFLARDRFGKKPLYYALFDNQLIFASELKAILKHPSVRREIDFRALAKYLAYEYVPSPYSIFKNIYKMKAASMLSVSDKDLYALDREGLGRRLRQYWDIDFNREGRKTFDLRCTEDRLLELLRISVKRRLVSDVPLGVFLSGGIDSSAVVSMMAELMAPKDIKTFSIGFRERPFDESSDARLVADHFGTDHHEEILDPGVMLEIFPKILDLLDEPFADSSIIPTYLVSKFTRKIVKVALGGDGGDELFFGYPSFVAHRLNDYAPFIKPLRKISAIILDKLIGSSYNHISLCSKARRFIRGLDFPDEIRHQVWTGSFTPKEEEGLFLPHDELDLEASSIYDLTKDLYGKLSRMDPLDRASYIYIKTYMTDDILAKVDRASMANSLEVRAPFLDHEFAQFAAGIPVNLKLRNFKAKWILKDALKGRLPKEILNKPKKGFAVPVAQWLKRDLKGLLLKALGRAKIEREGIFNYSYIDGLLKEFLANKNDTRKEIWALFMFEMWYDRWM